MSKPKRGVRIRDGRLCVFWRSGYLTTPTRKAQILRRNTGIRIYWPHVERKGRRA